MVLLFKFFSNFILFFIFIFKKETFAGQETKYSVEMEDGVLIFKDEKGEVMKDCLVIPAKVLKSRKIIIKIIIISHQKQSILKQTTKTTTQNHHQKQYFIL